ncbi:MAG TPA: class I SAM-dependent methyltransferase [Acidimicrobiales bacterium]|nr:class I SAM-dependent methyltransferase [Acidimicrobiales bacterium]
MLTVDYERLGLQAGERLLDMGAGGGRHAFECLRRGAHVTAFDLNAADLKDALAVMGGMMEAGEMAPGTQPGACNGSALDLPFSDNSFERIIASEVLEHIDDDRRAMSELARVLKPGGRIAVTVPRWGPELVNWALDDEYHAPAAVGGHVRIYRESALRGRLGGAGLRVVDRHHAHGLHAPYWWLKCALGVNRSSSNPVVKAYHDLLVLEMTSDPLPLQVAERVLQPLIGKSLILYAVKDRAGGEVT